MKRAIVLFATSLVAPGCLLSPGAGSGETEASVAPTVFTQVPEAEPLVYPREDHAARTEDGESSRMYLLELYQQALDERDALRAELADARTELEDERASLEAVRAELEQWKARAGSLETAVQQSDEKNRALAARLVEAQIGRLEAEKCMLEAKLAGDVSAEAER